MQSYSYSVTDLEAFESEAIEVELDSEDVVAYGTNVARQMLDVRPDLRFKGMCIVMYDRRGFPLSIVPLDPLQ